MKLYPSLLLAACTSPPALDAGPCENSFDPGQHSTLVVATSTPRFDAGTLTLVDLDSQTVCDDVVAASRDTVIDVGPLGEVVDVGRLGTDRISIFEPPDFGAPTTSFSVGRASNPQGAAFCGGAWWVPQLASAELQAFDASGVRIATVDLSPFADADGIPEASDAITDGRRLDLVLQRLDRDQAFAPTDHGHIVRVDCEEATLVADARTPPNPSLAQRGDERVILGVDGLDRWSGQGDLEPWIRLPEPAVLADFTDSGAGLVVTREPSGWHHIHCVSADGETSRLGSTEAFLTDVQVTDRGHIWVAAREGYADPEQAPDADPLPASEVGEIWRIEPETCSITDRLPTALMPYSLGVY